MKVKPGEPLRISATAWNRHDEAAEWYHKQKALGESGVPSPQFNSHVVVKVKNDTGEDLRRGEVVELTGYALTDLDANHLWFNGDTPDLTHVGWAVALRPIPSGEIGDCLVLGVCVAYVNVTDANHKYAKLKSGAVVLDSAESGPIKILYKPTGTGEKECAVLLGFEGTRVYIGKTDAALSKGSSGTVSRYSGGGSESDTSTDDTVKNLFADIGSGKWVAYVDIEGTFYAIAAEC